MRGWVDYAWNWVEECVEVDVDCGETESEEEEARSRADGDWRCQVGGGCEADYEEVENVGHEDCCWETVESVCDCS